MPKKEELRKKDVSRLSKELKNDYLDEFTEFISAQRLFKSDLAIKKENVVIYHTSNNISYLFEHERNIIPTLQSIRKFPTLLATITVDAGAVKFMINGADLFKPGMVEWDSFSKDQYVTVVNLKKSAMCIGIVKFNSSELPDKGKITTTVHHLNDAIWNYNLT